MKRIEREHQPGAPPAARGQLGRGRVMAEHRACHGCLDGCTRESAVHCVSCVAFQPWPCDAYLLMEEVKRLRAEIKRWEDFDFERDTPKRLSEHILALMVERDQWRQRAEVAERHRQRAAGSGEGAG